jgi:hypothetical protein
MLDVSKDIVSTALLIKIYDPGGSPPVGGIARLAQHIFQVCHTLEV